MNLAKIQKIPLTFASNIQAGLQIKMREEDDKKKKGMTDFILPSLR